MKGFQSAVRRTLKNKLNRKRSTRRVDELKGSATSISIKRYFHSHTPKHGWGLYSVTLNKQRVYEHLRTKTGKKKLYNFLAHFILSQLPLAEMEPEKVHLVVDRCKNKEEIRDFNAYITNQLEGMLPLNTPLFLSHEASQENTGLQAVDMYCWGLARKRSHGDYAWHNLFARNVRSDELYL